MSKRLLRFVSFTLVITTVILFSGCDEQVLGPGNTMPASTPPAATGPADTGTTAPDATTAPPDATSAPPETVAPTDTPSAAPTGTPDSGASPTPTAAPDTGSLTVPDVVGKANTTDKLTLRSKASSSGSAVAEIPREGEFTVLSVETGKKWLKVKYDGKEGFVPVKSVLLGGDEDTRVCMVISDGNLNVRSGAGTKNDVIGTVKTGSNLLVTSKTTVDGQTWYKVAIGDTTGYVIAKYCRISEK